MQTLQSPRFDQRIFADELHQNIEQALDSFTQATHSTLTHAGKTPVVWEGKTHFL
jgi:hypothetical protein